MNVTGCQNNRSNRIKKSAIVDARSEPQNVAILGAGGFARQIAWTIRRGSSFQVIAFVDETITETSHLDGMPVYPSVEKLSERHAGLLLLSGVGDPSLRRRWSRTHGTRFPFATIIDPSAVLAENSIIGAGCIVHAGTILSTEASVGDHSILGFNVSLSHESSVGKFSHIAGGVILNGKSRVGNGCRIGAGAIVLPGIEVGNDAVVGAGSVVTKHVISGTTVVGAPAQQV